MLRTIFAVFGVYILVCGLLGDYKPTENYTEVDSVELTESEQVDEIDGDSDYGMLAPEGDAIAMSPITGE